MSQIICEECEAGFEGRSDSQFCSAKCRKASSRRNPGAKKSEVIQTLKWHPEGSTGVLVKSEYLGGTSPFKYLDTFEQDDGSRYRLEQYSQWSPEQLNKLREGFPHGVQIEGFGVAEEAPRVTRGSQGWTKAGKR